MISALASRRAEVSLGFLAILDSSRASFVERGWTVGPPLELRPDLGQQGVEPPCSSLHIFFADAGSWVSQGTWVEDEK